MSDVSLSVVKRSLTIAGHRTSISLEEPFWDGLKALGMHRGQNLAQLVKAIDNGRGDANLSSALRVAVLLFYRDRRDQGEGGGVD
jgi:predicted DNA-binding ribbon-helix-helix protein